MFACVKFSVACRDAAPSLALAAEDTARQRVCACSNCDFLYRSSGTRQSRPHCDMQHTGDLEVRHAQPKSRRLERRASRGSSICRDRPQSRSNLTEAPHLLAACMLPVELGSSAPGSATAYKLSSSTAVRKVGTKRDFMYARASIKASGRLLYATPRPHSEL